VGLDLTQSISVARELQGSKSLFVLGPAGDLVEASTVVVAAEQYQQWTETVVEDLQRFHHEHPLRRGMPRGEVLGRLKVEVRWSNLVVDSLVAGGQLKDGGPWLALAGHTPTLGGREASALAEWDKRNQATPFAPPSWREGIRALGAELAAYYVDSGLGIQVAEDIVFGAQAYEDMVERVTNELTLRGSLTVAEVRDVLGASRKYALALLEHLDRLGVTRREGDLRRLGRAGGANSTA
jgi:selenocysteine-specific elongation factor